MKKNSWEFKIEAARRVLKLAKRTKQCIEDEIEWREQNFFCIKQLPKNEMKTPTAAVER